MTRTFEGWTRQEEIEEEKQNVVRSYENGRVSLAVEINPGTETSYPEWTVSVAHKDLEFDDKDYEPYQYPEMVKQFSPVERGWIGSEEQAIECAEKFMEENPEVNKEFFRK